MALLVHCFQIDLEFGMLVCVEERRTEGPGEKPFGARTKPNNKLDPRVTPAPGIEPGPQWRSRHYAIPVTTRIYHSKLK